MSQPLIETRELPATGEARRVMEICNACRYCEGFCDVFPAMARRRSFPAADLEYLANLCHGCAGCYHACQYAPPHEFAINVPTALAELRLETYTSYAWPQSFARLFERNGLIVALVTALSIALVLLLTTAFTAAGVLTATHRGPGAFYAVISHGAMVAVAGSTFLFACAALGIGFVRFWRRSGRALGELGNRQTLLNALKDAATLKNLGGGHGEGCNTVDASFSNERRWYHQLTMWGFALCFLATTLATFYDFALNRIAPYPFFSLPVIFGTLGGLGLLVGPAGLLWIKIVSDSRPLALTQLGMDYAFITLLFFTSLTGLALLALRETSAMGILLAVHLGFVLGLFLLMPYSKFVHGVYRFAALALNAIESRPQTVSEGVGRDLP